MIEEINKLLNENKLENIKCDCNCLRNFVGNLEAILDKHQEQEESPYCEVCGHCGYIGCCGIENFIDKHIKRKTNCKNEDFVIQELIELCEYKSDVFKQNEELLKFKNAWEELKQTLKSGYPPIYMKMDEIEQKHGIGEDK
jgi:hypothetical protein